MKKFIPLFFCLITVSIFAQQRNPVKWTLALQELKSGDLISFSSPVRSNTGAEFRLVINPDAACYCYVVVQSSNDGDVTVLYAGSIAKREWLSPPLKLTDPPGSESLFIIVSREEQKNLAQRISALKDNSGSMQKRALMNEIFRLRSDVSQFKETPEKPVLMGGATRGDPDKSKGVEYSGLETYVKTLSIEH